MAHSQAEKPAGVRPVGRTLTDRNNQGGRGDETTRLAGVDGVDQALLGQGQRQQQQQTENTVARLSLRGLAEMPCWSVISAKMLGGWNQRVV